jgi:hypothetical protein
MSKAPKTFQSECQLKVDDLPILLSPTNPEISTNLYISGRNPRRRFANDFIMTRHRILNRLIANLVDSDDELLDSESARR